MSAEEDKGELFALPADLYDQLAGWAAERGISLNELIVALLEQSFQSRH